MAKRESENTNEYVDEKPIWELDVVCGMDVDPRTTPFHYTYNGKGYHFCIKSCLEHFKENPKHYILMEQYHISAREERRVSNHRGGRRE